MIGVLLGLFAEQPVTHELDDFRFRLAILLGDLATFGENGIHLLLDPVALLFAAERLELLPGFAFLLLVVKGTLLAVIAVFAAQLTFGEVAEELDQVVFDLERIAADVAGDGFRERVAAYSSGFFELLFAARAGFALCLLLAGELAPCVGDESSSELLSGEAVARHDFEIPGSGGVHRVAVEGDVFIEPVEFLFLVGAGLRLLIHLFGHRGERMRPLLGMDRQIFFLQIGEILRIGLVHREADERPQDRRKRFHVLIGVFGHGKAQMFIHADILIGECNIVPNPGSIADVGDPVDPGPVKKLAGGFGRTENLFEFFIDHRAGRDIAVDGFPDHVPLRVKSRRLVICGVKLLRGNLFARLLFQFQFPVIGRSLVRVAVEEQPLLFELFRDFLLLLRHDRAVPVKQIFLFARPESLFVNIAPPGSFLLFRNILNPVLVLFQPFPAEPVKFRTFAAGCRLAHLNPVVFERSGNTAPPSADVLQNGIFDFKFRRFSGKVRPIQPVRIGFFSVQQDSGAVFAFGVRSRIPARDIFGGGTVQPPAVGLRTFAGADVVQTWPIVIGGAAGPDRRDRKTQIFYILRLDIWGFIDYNIIVTLA